MRKILNEWKKFLLETQQEDDEVVAQRIAATLAPMSLSGKSNEFLRKNKKRAMRVINDYLYTDNRSPFSLNPTSDMVTVRGSRYEFPERDFEERLIAALEILENPRLKFDFSAFNKEPEPSDNPNPGKYGRKEHGGGATSTGFAIPNRADDKAVQQAMALINDYKSYYQGKGEDYIITSVDYAKSLQSLLAAYEILLDIWNTAGAQPDHEEVLKLFSARESAAKALSVGIGMSPAEQAESHMENGQTMLAAGLTDSAAEFLAAKRIFKKLGEKDRERIAGEMFRKARRLR